MSRSGSGSGSEVKSNDFEQGEEHVDIGETLPLPLSQSFVLQTELRGEPRGERGQRGEGGAFMSASRPSNASARVWKWEDEQASRVRA